jgi:GTPase SAR1 family protein
MIDTNFIIFFLEIFYYYCVGYKIYHLSSMENIEIAFVGSVDSGKTSLVKRCLDKGFAHGSTSTTVGFDFYST